MDELRRRMLKFEGANTIVMSTEALLEKVKDFIKTADETDLSDLEAFIDAPRQDGWDWADLPDEVKAGIQEGLEQADRGETITWGDFKASNPKWFNK